MNPAGQEALQLRDIHLPPAPGLWPLAPGWWVVTALLALLIAGAAFWAWRRYRDRASERRTLRMLAELEDAFRSDRAPEKLARMSMLMRQIALARFPRRQVAALNGRAWLDFLDESGGQGHFAKGPGRVLASSHYQRALPADLDADALMALVRDWVRMNIRRTA